DRAGFVERSILANFLARGSRNDRASPHPGDHRAGRLAFLGLGCTACHFVPDLKRSEQGHSERVALEGLGDRMNLDDLQEFLGNRQGRCPDGRLRRFPIPPDGARDIAASLLFWSRPPASALAAEPPSPRSAEKPPKPTAEKTPSALTTEKPPPIPIAEKPPPT